MTEVGTLQGQPATATIGASGGTLSSGDGQISVVVPAGAVSKDTTFSLQALSATAPGALRAFRLAPEGTTFSSPVKIRFRYADEDLAGSTASALRIASQDTGRRWVTSTSTLSEADKTLTIETTHLSDWAILLGWRLVPGKANLKPGATLSLLARYCNLTEDSSGLMTLAATCQDIDEGLAQLLLLRNWSVNGTVGGSQAVGVVTQGTPSAVYTAPGAALSSPVAVSVEIQPPSSKRKELLVANVTVGSRLPSLIKGNFTYSEKRSGGTQTYEYAGKGVVTELKPSAELGVGTYRMAGTFALESVKLADGNCSCSGTTDIGDLAAGGGSMTLYPSENGESGTYVFSFSATLKFSLTCTKLQPDATCGDRTYEVPVGWGLETTGTFGTCSVTSTNAYTAITSFVGESHKRCGVDDLKNTNLTWAFVGQE